MANISEEKFRELIKNERNKNFITPFELVYKTFIDLGYHKKDSSYFIEHASEFIINMRSNCWKEFRPLENEFTTRMLMYLIETDRVHNMDSIEAIKDFTLEYPHHIYDLFLSNTQSRRGRAGKEFEAILQLLLIGADISSTEQGSIGKNFFQTHQIGKLVDFVIPSVVGYLINKRNTMLISAKTTLRERWQEVPEEVNRTGIREMYLATLDEAISEESLRIMYEANIVVVTTDTNKEEHYSTNNRVITFEEMLAIGHEISDKWKNYNYSDQDKNALSNHIRKQIDKYAKYDYVRKFYQNRLELFE